MGQNDRRPGAGRSWRILLVIFCVLLVAVAGTVQVAHTHADGTDSHSNCPLCVLAHVTVQLAQTPAPAPTGAVIPRVEALPRAILPSVLSTFALFTRPPPVAVVPA